MKLLKKELRIKSGYTHFIKFCWYKLKVKSRKKVMVILRKLMNYFLTHKEIRESSKNPKTPKTHLKNFGQTKGYNIICFP